MLEKYVNYICLIFVLFSFTRITRSILCKLTEKRVEITEVVPLPVGTPFIAECNRNWNSKRLSYQVFCLGTTQLM